MSIVCSGFAVLLMIFIHLFTYPHWLLPNVEFSSLAGTIGDLAIKVICSFGGICVYIFALISGYALMLDKSKYSGKQKILRIVTFLLVYELVLALFLLFGAVLGDTLPSNKNLLLNIIGLNTGVDKPWVNVPFAWYVAFYIEFIVAIPILLWCFGSRSKIKDMLSLAVICVLVYIIKVQQWNEISALISTTVFPFLSLCVGVLFSKYDLFEKIHSRVTGNFQGYVLIILLILMVAIPSIISGMNPNGGVNWSFFQMIVKTFLAPFVIIVFVELMYKPEHLWIRKILYFVGTLSMYLWFLHGIFFTGSKVLQPIIYSPKEPLLIFLLCVVSLIAPAMLLRTIHSNMIKRLR